MENNIIIMTFNVLLKAWPWLLPVIFIITLETLVVKKMRDPNSDFGRKTIQFLIGMNIPNIGDELSLMHQDSANKSALLELMDEIACNIRYLCEILDNKELLHEKLDDTFSLVFEVTNFFSMTKTGRSRISIWQKDPQYPDRLIIYKHEGFSIDYYETAQLSASNSIAGYVIQTGKTYNCPDVGKDPIYENKGSDRSYNSMLCVPVKLRRKCVAALCIDALKPSAFTQDDEKYLEYCANRIGILLALDEFAHGGM